jgi:16S rRNA (guanine527-N7)-methyltransferase
MSPSNLFSQKLIAAIKNVSRETFLELDPEIVSRETISKFEEFFNLHEKYKKFTSLARYASEEEFIFRHVIDSLQLHFYLVRGMRILDIGSGGGFPGIVLAIMGHSIILSERDAKKKFFLEECIRVLDLPNAIVIEDAQNFQESVNVVTARAVTNLNDLLFIIKNVSRETFLKSESEPEIVSRETILKFDQKNLVAEFSPHENSKNKKAQNVSRETFLKLEPKFINQEKIPEIHERDDKIENVSRETFFALFSKGEKYGSEVIEAQKNWAFNYHEFPSKTEPKSVILKIWNIRPRG